MSRDLRPEELDQTDPEPSGPRLVPTSGAGIAGAAVVGAVLALGLVWGLSGNSILPVTPWTMSTLLAVLGIAALIYARRLKQNLAQAPAEVAPESGVLAFVVGRTLLLVGALLAGGHLAYALTQLGGLDRPMPRQRLIFALLAAVCAAVMALGGAALERAVWLGKADRQD